MIKRYEVPDRIKADPNGELVAYLDHKEALALIAEMKELLAYTAPFCEVRDDHDACMRLVARAEELLRD